MGLERDAIDHVVAEYRRLLHAATLGTHWAGEAVTKIDGDLRAAIARLQADHKRLIQAAGATHQRSLDQARQALLSQVARQVTAPIQQAERALGLPGLPWTDPMWSQPSTPGASGADPPRTIPEAIRIGALQWGTGAARGTGPALLALTGARSVVFVDDQAGAGAGIAAVQNAAMRIAATFPPGSYRFTLVDPAGVGQNLKTFLRLPPSVRRDKIYCDGREIEEETRRLLRHIETVTQNRLRDVASIEEYHARPGSTPVPYQFLIVANFPAGFTDAAAGALLSLVKNGPRTGTFLIASVDGHLPPGRGVDLPALLAPCTVVTLAGAAPARWNDPDFAPFPIALDAPPPAALADHLLDRAAAATGWPSPSATTTGWSSISSCSAPDWSTTG